MSHSHWFGSSTSIGSSEPEDIHCTKRERERRDLLAYPHRYNWTRYLWLDWRARRSFGRTQNAGRWLAVMTCTCTQTHSYLIRALSVLHMYMYIPCVWHKYDEIAALYKVPRMSRLKQTKWTTETGQCVVNSEMFLHVHWPIPFCTRGATRSALGHGNSTK